MSLWDWVPLVGGDDAPTEKERMEACDHDWETIRDGYAWFDELRPEDGELIYEVHQQNRRVCTKCDMESRGLIGDEALSQHVFETDRIVENPEDTIWGLPEGLAEWTRNQQENDDRPR